MKNDLKRDDLISREWLLDVVENTIEWDTERDRNRAIHQVRELTPTVDAVEVVRCWECIHRENPGTANPACGIHVYLGGNTFFCADGQRRGGGDT